MAINMMCMNENCVHYWEDNCMKNMNEARIVISSDGKCETFEEGVNELYNCEYSKNGKCNYFGDNELNCCGTEKEKDKCMIYTEMG